jgi:hypothetical protein
MSTSGGTSNAKGEELARQFEQINAEVIAFVEGCDEAAWKATCADDERSVGAVSAHIANAYRPVVGWVNALAAGQPVSITMDDIHGYNAQAAAADTARSQSDVADALRRNGAIAAGAIRQLSDVQLAQTAHFGPAGAPLSAETVATYTLLGHPRSHLKNMRGSRAG